MDLLKKHSGFFNGLLSIIILFLTTFKLAAKGMGHDILSEKRLELAVHDGGEHNRVGELNINNFLYNICKNDIEGYSKKLFGRDYNHPSVREDLDQGMMISWQYKGDKSFEFLTGEVPENYNREEVSFFFYSDIDLNLRDPFDIKINDKFILTFTANEDGTLTVSNNSGNCKAEFILIEKDENNDGIGAFRLTVPISFIAKGQGAKINVQRHKKDSNSWFMIFKADDVIKRLKLSVKNDASFNIRQNDGFLYIDAPAHFANKTVSIVSDGETSKKSVFKISGNLAKAIIKINIPKRNFKILYDENFIEIAFENKSGISTKTEIIGEYLQSYNTEYKNGSWSASVSKIYQPLFFKALANFFNKENNDGLISIINSSHQDIAWMDSPEACIIERDTMLLTPVIKDALIRNEYGFDIEDGLMLREYLARHPEVREKITTLLNKKLISVGASYNCPYEDMYDSEDLVRQFYLGKKWVKKTFGGYDSKVYWNVDVPGRTLQFPQILKKAGVDFMVISRHDKSMFNWESPDGSTVFAYSSGKYNNDYKELLKDMKNKIKYGAEQVTFWNQYFPNSKTTSPLLSSFDMLPAIDYTDFIETWNGFESLKGGDGNVNQVYLPEMGVMTSDKFMPLAQQNATNIKTIRGERPNVWVYIHGPAHHEAITASREASKILPAAEKFLSIANILDSKRAPYPLDDLDKAWQSKIYPDHGWGGHHGDITDNLFKAKLVESRSLGNDLLNKGTRFIANRIKTNENNGIPVILFNSLSWDRTDPVKVSINLEKGNAKSLQVLTFELQKVESQITNAKYFDDGSIKSADIVFIAKKIPSIGYKTYYIKSSQLLTEKSERVVSPLYYENEAYKINFEKGGIGQIYDKQLKRNLLKTDIFKGGEVFTLNSVGNGAGEFGDIQQPTMQDFDKVSNHNADWEVVENGDVYTTYRIKQDILHATVQQDVTIYHELKRVLFETQLLNWDGTIYREFRTAFPVAIENAMVTYEVPFGSVRVGHDEIKTAGDRYTPLCKDVHPRSIMDWFSASDKDMTVTLSSSVAAIDWIDPTSESKETVLQHLLLASRTSCHWNGNEYSQEGSHSYNNILTSGITGDINNSRIAEQQNEPIHITLYPDKSITATLPESASFFGLNNENITITTIKRAEDSEDMVIRMYDGQGTDISVDLTSFFKIDNLKQMNIIEENAEPVTSMNVSKYGIETFSFGVKR